MEFGAVPHDLEPLENPLAERFDEEMFKLTLGHLALIWDLIHGDDDEA